MKPLCWKTQKIAQRSRGKPFGLGGQGLQKMIRLLLLYSNRIHVDYVLKLHCKLEAVPELAWASNCIRYLHRSTIL